jgi:hypothetical protein
MQFRALFTVVVLLCACRSAVAEPKAYEVVKYKGAANGVTIALDYGDGYPQASHLWVTDGKSGKTTRFMLDESGEMRFVPKKPSAQKREIILKMGMDDGPAERIEGIYTVDGKQTPVTLRKID